MMKDIRENIEAIRKEKGIKQEVLAEKLGIKQGTFSGYLTQNKNIRYELLLEIANELNVDIVYLIKYPQIYVPQEQQCAECQELKKTIKNMNAYIEILEKGKK